VRYGAKCGPRKSSNNKCSFHSCKYLRVRKNELGRGPTAIRSERLQDKTPNRK
jgi:hypothetical protein